jgi:membrane protein DedA with SNARE-associated domain
MSGWLLAFLLGVAYAVGNWIGYIWGRMAEREADAVRRATAEQAEWEERKP